jgi:cytochrome b561
MQWRNTKEGFGWISIVLHWVTVPLVIFLLACGIYMKTLDYYEPLYHQLPQWHKTLGMLLGTLLLIRLGWIVISPAPTPITPNLLQRWLAKGVHFGMYAMLIVICFSGYLFTTADGKPMELLGGIIVPNLVTVSEESVDLLGAIHRWISYGLGVLVALHASAAIYHHLALRDNTFKRILFPNRN